MTINRKTLKHILTLLTICMFSLFLAGISRIPVSAAGPHDDEGAYLGIEFADNTGMKYLYSSYSYYKTSKVNGATYDKKTNTLTLTNARYGSRPYMEIWNMGSDFKVKLVGSNSIGYMVVLSWDGNNSLTITGSGTLEANAAGTYDAPITLCDWTDSTKSKCKITIENGPKLILHKGRYGCITLESDTKKASVKSFIVIKGNCSPAPSYARMGDSENCKYNYKVTNSITITKKPPKKLTKSATKITVAACTYTGLAQKPRVTVKYKGKKLTAGSDYTLTYKNNKAAGSKAKVIITGKGLYKGILTKTFTIKRRKLTYSKITASLISSSYDKTYTGNAKKPTVRVKYKQSSKKTLTLKKDTDYTLSYKNNINAGTGTIIIKGKGNYTGTKNVSFKITKASQDELSVDQFPLNLTSADIGKQIVLTYSGVKESAEVSSITSDNPEVIEVAEDGTLTVNGVGETVIKVKFAATANYKACTLTEYVDIQEAPENQENP